MIATVRLDADLEKTLLDLTQKLHKKKSDIIRDSISFYAKNIDKTYKSRIQKAAMKTKEIDRREFLDFEDMVDDGI
jgi:predicted transcriptional regulator